MMFVTSVPASRASIGWVVVSLAVTVAGCSRERAAQAKSNDQAKPVAVTTVKREDVRRAIEVVGTLSAVEEVTVSAEAEGKVSAIRADLGDRVKTGQVLVDLDREKLQYRLEQQRAALSRVMASYGVEDASRPLPPVESVPDVKKAAAELAQADQAFKRADELHKRSLLPSQQLDDAQGRLQSARASYDAAVQNARNLRAEIDASGAALHLAERELRDAEIRAPFDGYVQKRLVSPGQFVRVQTPVMMLVKTDPLKVIAEIPERMAPWVKVGQAIELRVDAYPDRVLNGSIARVSPGVNEQTRAFPFEGHVANPDGALKPGGFARVRIASDRVDTVLSLPASALQFRYGVNRVFVVSGDRLVSHEVKLGDRLGDRFEIVSGVAPGDQIAISDIERLADGLRVSIDRTGSVAPTR
jgi:multidrug efflux pump subunit AcrA (membrane-fusion protein)